MRRVSVGNLCRNMGVHSPSIIGQSANAVNPSPRCLQKSSVERKFGTDQTIKVRFWPWRVPFSKQTAFNPLKMFPPHSASAESCPSQNRPLYFLTSFTNDWAVPP